MTMDHHGAGWPFWRHAMRAAFGPFGAGGPAVKRGIVRLAVLRTLLDGPKHGYQIIQDLEAKTGGRWRPSAGSVYPTLQQLEDEGLVRSEERDGRRVYVLTEEGRRAAEDVRGGPAERFFEGRAERGTDSLHFLAAQVVVAAVQVERIGSSAARERADAILREARRELYRILAEDDAGAATSDPGDGGEARR
jgi:DNA-binding PadR family transcriptional regulator